MHAKLYIKTTRISLHIPHVQGRFEIVTNAE